MDSLPANIIIFSYRLGLPTAIFVELSIQRIDGADRDLSHFPVTLNYYMSMTLANPNLFLIVKDFDTD